MINISKTEKAYPNRWWQGVDKLSQKCTIWLLTYPISLILESLSVSNVIVVHTTYDKTYHLPEFMEVTAGQMIF